MTPQALRLLAKWVFCASALVLPVGAIAVAFGIRLRFWRARKSAIIYPTLKPPRAFPPPPPLRARAMPSLTAPSSGCDHAPRQTITANVSAHGGIWTYWCPACGALGKHAIAGQYRSGPDWQHPRRAAQ